MLNSARNSVPDWESVANVLLDGDSCRVALLDASGRILLRNAALSAWCRENGIDDQQCQRVSFDDGHDFKGFWLCLPESVQNAAKPECTDALIDSLTGLVNRRGLSGVCKTRVINKTGKVEPGWLLFFDINHFKQVNDSLGHMAGDRVLKRFAACLKESFRCDDIVARYGGDEFVVACPGCSRRVILERIKELRLRLTNEFERKGIKLSASFGMTPLVEGEPFEKLIEAADRDYYRRKRHGRADHAS